MGHKSHQPSSQVLMCIEILNIFAIATSNFVNICQLSIYINSTATTISIYFARVIIQKYIYFLPTYLQFRKLSYFNTFSCFFIGNLDIYSQDKYSLMGKNKNVHLALDNMHRLWTKLCLRYIIYYLNTYYQLKLRNSSDINTQFP